MREERAILIIIFKIEFLRDPNTHTDTTWIITRSGYKRCALMQTSPSLISLLRVDSHQRLKKINIMNLTLEAEIIVYMPEN